MNPFKKNFLDFRQTKQLTLNVVRCHKGCGPTLILGLYMQDLRFSDRCS